jgi:hypothetical protein
MDKTPNIAMTTSSKRGFALMITLSVLSVVIALTMVLLSYFNEVKKDADTTKALIQANVYYADILSQFNKFKNKKTLFSQLYRSSTSLRSPEGRFKLLLRCNPIANGVNINWLALEHDTKKQALFQEVQTLFDVLAQQYNLEDADRLLEMILLEIGIDKKFSTREQSRLRQKYGIISAKQFLEIIQRYQLEVDDEKVGRIPWNKYFSFSGKSEKINVEYSSAELISYLFDIDLVSVREWMSSREKPALKTFVENNGGDYNAKKGLLAAGTFLGESSCEIRYGDGYRFTFNYIEGEAKHFEFFGKH